MNDKDTQQKPYKGLLPYEEGDAQFFFGREAECEVITANLTASKLTLLYGSSGVGKSSVLRAGVAHDLRHQAKEQFRARGRAHAVISVFNSWRDDPIAGLRSQITADVADVSGNGKPLANGLAFKDFLKAASQDVGGKLLIVLDQFEEYFLYPQREGQGSFTYEFVRAVASGDVRVNFLISIREDWLAKLDIFKKDLPGVFDNYLRIERLEHDSALAAIEEPVAKYNELRQPHEPEITIRKGFSEAVLAQLERLANKNILSQTGSGEVKDKLAPVAETRIQTPYLQLVMTHFWAEAVAGSHILGPDMLADEHRCRKIIQNHLDTVMGKLDDHEQGAAASVFNQLVTPSGTKITQSIFDLAAYARVPEEVLSPILEKLTEKQSGILTQIAPAPGQQGTRYEIFHDVLAAPILDWCKRYLDTRKNIEQEQQLAVAQKEAEDERKRAEEQKVLAEALALRAEAEEQTLEAERQKIEILSQRADEQIRSARRLRRLASVLAIAFGLALVLGGVAWWQTRRANAYANQSEELRRLGAEYRQSGDLARSEAVLARAEASQRTLDAEAAEKRAKDEQDKAKLATDLAGQATVSAASERAKAKQARTDAEQAKTAAQTDQMYAEALRLSRTYNTRTEAIEKMTRVLIRYLAAGNGAAATSTLVDMGGVRLEMRETSLAKTAFNEALEKTASPLDKASTALRIGGLYQEATYDRETRQLALQAYNQALEIYRSLANKRGQANASLGIGQIQNWLVYDNGAGSSERQKAVAESIEALDEAIALFQELDDIANEALALYGRASTLEIDGRNNEAIEYYRRALSAYESVRDHSAQIYTLRKLVELNKKIRDEAAVRANQTALANTYALALEWHREIRDRDSEISTLRALVGTYEELNDVAAVRRHRLRLAESLKRYGNRYDQADVYIDLALAHLPPTGPVLNAAEAIEYLTRAQNLLVEWANEPGRTAREREQAGSRIEFAVGNNLAYKLNTLPEAAGAYEAALTAYETSDAKPSDLFRVLNALAWIKRDLRDTSALRTYVARSQTAADRITDLKPRGDAFVQIGQRFLDLREFNTATEYFQRAIATARQYQSESAVSGDRAVESFALFDIGKYYAALSMASEARDYFTRALETETSAVGKHVTLATIGATYAGLREYETAIAYYEESLKVARENQLSVLFEAKALNELAGVYRSRAAEGDIARAEAAEQRARELSAAPSPTPAASPTPRP